MLNFEQAYFIFDWRANLQCLHSNRYWASLFYETKSFSSEDRTKGSLSRSEEHTSELQSRQYLVCRLLLEKKKEKNKKKKEKKRKKNKKKL